MYKALHKESGVYVAVKKVHLSENDVKLQTESELLMKCRISPFIVRYLGVIQNENELNVWIE